MCHVLGLKHQHQTSSLACRGSGSVTPWNTHFKYKDVMKTEAGWHQINFNWSYQAVAEVWWLAHQPDKQSAQVPCADAQVCANTAGRIWCKNTVATFASKAESWQFRKSWNDAGSPGCYIKGQYSCGSPGGKRNPGKSNTSDFLWLMLSRPFSGTFLKK